MALLASPHVLSLSLRNLLWEGQNELTGNEADLNWTQHRLCSVQSYLGS